VAGSAVLAARYEPLGTCPGLFERRIDVADASELRQALARARPGDMIEMADGLYVGRFELRRDGAPDSRITLCGRRAAVIEGPDMTAGEYGIHITADHWTLIGFTVRHHSKGIVADDGDHLILKGLEVHDIGGEGIRLRVYSSDNLITETWVHDTGREEPSSGEGIYIGTAVSQWCRNTDCEPDESDRNVVTGNVVGPGTTAENIDLKEGTTGGIVSDNVLDGTGMTETDSWIDVKGNGWTIIGNRGVNAPLDGFQTHVTTPGWGEGNRFERNIAEVRGRGYGFNIDVRGEGNTVTCDNDVRNAAAGMANVTCVAAEARVRPHWIVGLAVAVVDAD
jgi:hypothetical protein